jgi:hypothetical protein
VPGKGVDLLKGVGELGVMVELDAVGVMFSGEDVAFSCLFIVKLTILFMSV